MRCLSALGEGIAAGHPDSQTAEIQIRGAHIDRVNAFGTAVIICVTDAGVCSCCRAASKLSCPARAGKTRMDSSLPMPILLRPMQ